jgi:hypothetical protein
MPQIAYALVWARARDCIPIEGKYADCCVGGAMAHGRHSCMRHGEPSVEEFWIAHPRVSQVGEWRANYGVSRLPRGERRFRQERIGAAPAWGLISWPNDLIARENSAAQGARRIFGPLANPSPPLFGFGVAGLIGRRRVAASRAR